MPLTGHGKEVSERLRIAMAYRQVGPKELAAASGVDVDDLNDRLNEGRSRGRGALKLLSKALGVSHTWLQKGIFPPVWSGTAQQLYNADRKGSVSEGFSIHPWQSYRKYCYALAKKWSDFVKSQSHPADESFNTLIKEWGTMPWSRATPEGILQFDISRRDKIAKFFGIIRPSDYEDGEKLDLAFQTMVDGDTSRVTISLGPTEWPLESNISVPDICLQALEWYPRKGEFSARITATREALLRMGSGHGLEPLRAISPEAPVFTIDTIFSALREFRSAIASGKSADFNLDFYPSIGDLTVVMRRLFYLDVPGQVDTLGRLVKRHRTIASLRELGKPKRQSDAELWPTRLWNVWNYFQPRIANTSELSELYNDYGLTVSEMHSDIHIMMNMKAAIVELEGDFLLWRSEQEIHHGKQARG